MKRIEIKSWCRRPQFELFNNYSVPTYSITSRLDVTALMKFHNRGGYLFDAMLYAVWRGMCSVEELRLRIDCDGVVLYDTVHPVFTVALENNNYASCRIDPCNEFSDFTKQVRQGIEETKSGVRTKKFDDGCLNDFYFSCLPGLDFTGLEQPVSADPYMRSVPMAVWGKIIQKCERYEVALQITVHHALVDGIPLSNAFAAIQREINTFENRSVTDQ